MKPGKEIDFKNKNTPHPTNLTISVTQTLAEIKRTLPSLFYDINITLISNHDKATIHTIQNPKTIIN